MSATTISGSLDNNTRKHFSGMQASSCNVEGVDSGDIRFTTRSDIGQLWDSNEIPKGAAIQTPGPTVSKKQRGTGGGEAKVKKASRNKKAKGIVLINL